MYCVTTNGRINIMQPPADQFSLYDKISTEKTTSFSDAMNGNWEVSNLSIAYFSEQNITIVQNGIRAGVYNKSNEQYIIAPQNNDTLKIIMRSVFLQNSTNQLDNITKQIEELNGMVIDYCVKQVYGEAQGYINYRRDASTMYTPIPRPTQPDFNNKTLELKKWF